MEKEGWLGIAQNKKALFFFLIALAASIPIILTLKQRKFYLIPSILFYILAITSWIYPLVSALIEQVPSTITRYLKPISGLGLAGVLVFSIVRFGAFSKDEEKLEDVYSISHYLPEGSVISTPKSLWEDWGLAAYLSRVGYLSLDADHKHPYYLTQKDLEPDTLLLNEYQRVDLVLNKYTFFEQKPSNLLSSIAGAPYCEQPGLPPSLLR